LFRATGEIIAALREHGDVYDPKTCSVIQLGRSRSASQEPFRYGFIGTFDTRAELVRLLRILDARSRALLILWYHDGRPVTQVARALNISRVHCYRVRDQALEKMLDESKRQHERKEKHA
jgi:DNA-directed RNA polymerase specialized sigma24 family protein